MKDIFDPFNMLKNKRAYILLVWAMVHILLFAKNGIGTTLEAEKYIGAAESILQNGKIIQPDFWLYATQSFLILIDKVLHAHFLLAITVQMIFSLWAAFAFYSLVRHIFSDSIAFCSTIFFLLNYPFHEFNTLLQTESLYYSFGIIFTSYLLRLPLLTYKNVLIIIAFLFLLGITRPTGILFSLPAGLYMICRFRKNIRAYHLAIFCACILLFLWTINLSVSSGGRFDLMFPFKTEQVICFVVEIPGTADIKIADNGNSLQGLLYYITHNFEHFSKLALKKGIAFFGLIRPYFSRGHNIFLAAYFYPIYILAIAGIRYWTKNYFNHLLYFIALIGMVLGTTLLTCDDWHNRFFLSISPYLIILSIPAARKIFKALSTLS